MLNDYMPKSGGRFTGDITTQRIVSESTIALQGLGGDFGTIITAGPWGGGQGAALQLNGALAQNSGFGNNGEWALLHRCRMCGTIHANRVAADDNPLLLMSLASKPLACPPFPLGKLEELAALSGVSPFETA